MSVAITGPSSFVIALYANGGITSRPASGSLATLWIATTGLAWRAIRQRRWAEHRAWMIRSYALRLSAITLRV